MALHASEALINARFSTVWDVLTDSGNMTVWNSGITEIDGDLRDGETVRITTLRRGRPVRARVRQDLDDFVAAARHRAELLDRTS